MKVRSPIKLRVHTFKLQIQSYTDRPAQEHPFRKPGQDLVYKIEDIGSAQGLGQCILCLYYARDEDEPPRTSMRSRASTRRKRIDMDPKNPEVGLVKLAQLQEKKLRFLQTGMVQLVSRNRSYEGGFQFNSTTQVVLHDFMTAWIPYTSGRVGEPQRGQPSTCRSAWG